VVGDSSKQNRRTNHNNSLSVGKCIHEKHASRNAFLLVNDFDGPEIPEKKNTCLIAEEVEQIAKVGRKVAKTRHLSRSPNKDRLEA